MYDSLWRHVVPLLLRFTLAAIFLVHGFHKVADIGNEAGLAWAHEVSEPPSRGVQLVIAWGELAVGAMLAIGLWTRLAAAGAIAMIAGGMYSTHTVQGWSTDNHYEYIALLLATCVALLLTGGGSFGVTPSLHYYIRRRREPVPRLAQPVMAAPVVERTP